MEKAYDYVKRDLGSLSNVTEIMNNSESYARLAAKELVSGNTEKALDWAKRFIAAEELINKRLSDPL